MQSATLPDVDLAQVFDSERDMLDHLAQVLANVDDHVTLAGHNVVAFDLPRLRYRMAAHAIRMPRVLLDPGWPTFDTMREFRRFSINGTPMIGLSDLLERFGIEHHKDLVSGAMAPELWRTGQVESLTTYCMLDVLSELRLVQRMSGMEAGLLVVDVETSDARPEEAEHEMRMTWAPSRTWKPETVGRRYLEACEKRDAKLELCDASPVVAVGLCSDAGLQCLYVKPAQPEQEATPAA